MILKHPCSRKNRRAQAGERPSIFSRSRRLLQRGYTLIEVLAAGAVVAIGMSAMASLTGTMMLQEEMSWRVSVARNYQENMGRLWQLGLGTDQVINLMPAQSDNPQLAQILFLTPSIVQLGTTNPSSLGTMQVATITGSVNISQNPGSKTQGTSLAFNVYRPSLPSALRPGPPAR